MHTQTAPPSTAAKRPPTVRVAAWSAANPWKAMLAWAVFVAVCFGAGTAAGTHQVAFSDFWIGEAGDAETIALEHGLTAPAVERILITAPAGDLDPEAAAEAAADVTARMNALDEVADVAAPVTAASGDAVMLAVTMSMPAHEADDHIDPLLETTAAVQEAHPGLDIAETGGKSISAELNDQLGSQLGQVERFTLPITLAILFIVFGSLLLAGVPLALAITSIIAALGAYALASHLFPDAGGAVTSVLAMIGMAVGVDYSLFYLKRVREEHRRNGGLAPAAAIEHAAATAGRTIVTSGIAVIVSLAGLYLVDDVIFSSIATACIIVVAIAMISSLTVLPAMLATIGRRIDGGRLLRRKATAATPGEGRLWSALLRPSLRHPVATAVIGLAVIGGLALPALTMTTSVEGKESFPKSLGTIAAYDDLVAEFPAEGLAHSVVAQADDPAALAAAAAELEERTRGDALFAATDAPRIAVADDGTAIRLDLPIPYATSDPRAAESLALLRDDLVPDTIGQVPGVAYAVSGEPAYAKDYADHQSARLFLVVGSVLLATVAVMLIAFRSLVFALLSMVLNLLSTLAAWGALALVFQHTWAEGLLHFDSPGFVGSRTPLMVFAILFGLSLDYQLFVMSRIREAALAGAAPREAIRQGIRSSASVVTSAAVIMMSVFVAFVFIDRIEMKQLGFALALGVLLDAVVVRVMLLPALMALVDRAGRWPRAWKTVEQRV